MTTLVDAALLSVKVAFVEPFAIAAVTVLSILTPFKIKVTSPGAFTITEYLKLPDNVYVPASLIVKLLSYSLKFISLELTICPASTSSADVS